MPTSRVHLEGSHTHKLLVRHLIIEMSLEGVFFAVIKLKFIISHSPVYGRENEILDPPQNLCWDKCQTTMQSCNCDWLGRCANSRKEWVDKNCLQILMLNNLPNHAHNFQKHSKRTPKGHTVPQNAPSPIATRIKVLDWFFVA